jgi:hypothetical protein
MVEGGSSTAAGRNGLPCLHFRLTPITVTPIDRFPTETWATNDNFLPLGRGSIAERRPIFLRA